MNVLEGTVIRGDILELTLSNGYLISRFMSFVDNVY